MKQMVTVCPKCGAAMLGSTKLVLPAYGCDGAPCETTLSQWAETAYVGRRITEAGHQALAGRAALREGGDAD